MTASLGQLQTGGRHWSSSAMHVRLWASWLLWWPLLACSTNHAPCPATVTTEQAAPPDAGSLWDEDAAAPSAQCVSLCGIYVLHCSDSYPCTWRSGSCVTCTFENRCGLVAGEP